MNPENTLERNFIISFENYKNKNKIIDIKIKNRINMYFTKTKYTNTCNFFNNKYLKEINHLSPYKISKDLTINRSFNSKSIKNMVNVLQTINSYRNSNKNIQKTKKARFQYINYS